MPSRNRPPESWSSVAAVIAVIAAERPGICMIAAPSLIARSGRRARRGSSPRRSRRPPRSTRSRSRAAPPPAPARAARPREPEAPVADVDAELHARLRPAAGRRSRARRIGGVRRRKRTASTMSAAGSSPPAGPVAANSVMAVSTKPGQSAVDLIPSRVQLLVHRLGPADHGGLGRGVDGQPGLARLAGDRRHVHDERVAVLGAGRAQQVRALAVEEDDARRFRSSWMSTRLSAVSAPPAPKPTPALLTRTSRRP